MTPKRRRKEGKEVRERAKRRAGGILWDYVWCLIGFKKRVSWTLVDGHQVQEERKADGRRRTEELPRFRCV